MIDLASIPAYLNKLGFSTLRKLGFYRGFNHICEVKVYDKRGKLKAFRFMRQELILDNFKNMLAEIIYPLVTVPSGSYRTASMVDVGGVTRAPSIYSGDETTDGYAHGLLCSGRVNITLGCIIRIGTSTVAPARGDYALGAEYASGTPTQTIGADFISWSIGITLTTVATITEAGLSCLYQYQKYPNSPATAHFLLFRDTFTGVVVPDGGTISITEKVTL